MKFYEWDYDNNRVITWRREGECNNCGQCCKDAALINFDYVTEAGVNRYYDESGFKPQDGSHYSTQEGSWTEQHTDNDDDRRFFGNVRVVPQDEPWKPCGSWTGKGCAIHETKPGLCKTWPHTPKQIEGFTECSYTFVKEAESEINSNGD